AFLALPVGIRKKIAQAARERSKQAYTAKPAPITDVNDKAIADAFNDSQADVLIHGHTHRSALHHPMVNGKRRTRLVLPDWDHEQTQYRSGWAVVSRHGVELHRWC